MPSPPSPRLTLIDPANTRLACLALPLRARPRQALPRRACLSALHRKAPELAALLGPPFAHAYAKPGAVNKVHDVALLK